MMLEYMPYRACESIIKLLVSVCCIAIANETQQLILVCVEHSQSCTSMLAGWRKC